MNYTKESDITEKDFQLLENYNKVYRKGSVFYRFPDVLKMRKEGKTLEQVARFFGVTRERVRQMEAKAIAIIIKLRRVSEKNNL